MPGRPPHTIATKIVPIVSRYKGTLRGVTKNEHKKLIAVPKTTNNIT